MVRFLKAPVFITTMVLCAWAAACSFDSGGPNGADPDADASSDASDSSGFPPDGPCVPGATQCTSATNLALCNNAGIVEEQICPFGCVEGDTAHCGFVGVSNGLDIDNLDGADADFKLTGNNKVFVANTDTGRIFECGAADLRAAGEGIVSGIHFESVPVDGRSFGVGVFSLNSLEVDSTTRLYLVGANAAAFLVGGPVDIKGEILGGGGVRACNETSACDGVGFQRCGGPGAHGVVDGVAWISGGDENHDPSGDDPAPNDPAISSGKGPGGGGFGSAADGATLEMGGGGGGHGAVGAAGGGIGGGAWGALYGEEFLVPLAGGSGGGGGGSVNTESAGQGGGGGGALQISSFVKIHVHGSGAINVGGAGGTNGTGAFGNGGGGGGAGGAILFEAPILDLDGDLAANGGGGGSGSGTGAGVGANGSYADSPAVGGGSGGLESRGGSGGAATLPAQPGEVDSLNADGSGGGGGAVGRIYLRSDEGGIDMGAGSTVSPTPVTAETIIE